MPEGRAGDSPDPSARRSDGVVPLRVLWAYAAPSFPVAMLLLAAYVYLPTFYAEQLGMDLAVIGAVLVGTRLLDVVSDPLVGWLSDRTRTRWGRRRPFILLGVPLIVLSVYMLMIGHGAAPGAWHLLVWTLTLSLGWTLVTLPIYAWGAELSDQYHQRSRVAGARQWLGVFGTLAVILLAASPDAVAGLDRGAAMALIGWVVIGLLPLAIVVQFSFVPNPQIAVGRRQADAGSFWQRLRQALREFLSNQPLRRLVVANFFNALANGLPGTLFLLYVGNILMLGDMEIGIFMLTYFGACILSMPLWVRFSYRVGKHRAWSVSIILACLSFPIVLFLGPGDFWPFLVMSALTGVALGADLAFPAAIQADIVDADHVASGRQRAGTVFGLNQMAAKVAFAVAVGLAFPTLALFGFDAENKNNGATPLMTLKVLYGLVPVLFKAVVFALIFRFPLDAARQKALREEISRLG